MRIMSAPYYISWNYTYLCNFNCSHCYSRAPWYPEELSTDSYERIANELADAGVFRVALGGGEPLIRQDSIQILALLSARGIETNLTTNGWMLGDREVEALKAANLTRLYVSVDSANAIEHDSFRRKPGSFDRVTSAARLAVGAGLSVHFSTVLTRQSASKIAEITEVAEALGVEGIEFKRFRPAGNGKAFEAEYKVEDEQSQQMIETFRRLKAKTGLDLMLVNGPETNITDKDTVGCVCGVKSLCIRPNGDVSPCAYSDVVIGNLQTTTLRELWAHSPHLATMRSGSGCQALLPISNPLNPAANIFSSRRAALVNIN